MAVYVDDMQAPYGRLVMCHMIADTHRELIEMADRIDLARKWIQSAGRSGEHFDICKVKRALAVEAGALEVTMREAADRCAARRHEAGRRAYYEEGTC